MSILTSVFAFLFAIAVLVAIHEFGHYWVAKKLGVKVLRYSIGFGKPLWRRVSGEDKTEYVIAAIPLGGYVKMLDEREGDVPEEERHRAFNTQTVGVRTAIVAAGPLFNFLFAILAYAGMYMVGVNGLKPVIGHVLPESIAEQAGVVEGMQIQRVNDRTVHSWESATLTIINEALEAGYVELAMKTEDGSIVHTNMDLSDSKHLLSEGDILENIGLKPWRPKIPAVLGELVDDGPAMRAGLRAGDEIISLDRQPVELWQDVVKFIHARPDERIKVVVLRGGEEKSFSVRTESAGSANKPIGRIGVLPKIDQAQVDAMRVTMSYGPMESLWRATERTWDMSILTLRVLWKMVTGQASLKNISGPLTIAEFAGVSALIGVSAFLSFLGIVSVSLGVLNLLPVPVLDGGHLLYFFIEFIKGSPLSETMEALGQRVGLVILGGLMFLAFYNDISRLMS